MFWLLWKIKDQREEEENFEDFKMTSNCTVENYYVSSFIQRVSSFIYMFTFQRDWSLHISGGVIRNSIFYHLQSLPTSSHQAPRQTLLLQCRLCLKKEKRLPVWKIIVFSVSPDYITFWVMHISTTCTGVLDVRLPAGWLN